MTNKDFKVGKLYHFSSDSTLGIAFTIDRRDVILDEGIFLVLDNSDKLFIKVLVNQKIAISHEACCSFEIDHYKLIEEI